MLSNNDDTPTEIITTYLTRYQIQQQARVIQKTLNCELVASLLPHLPFHRHMLFSIVVLLTSLLVFENYVLPATATDNPPTIVFHEKITWFNLDSPTEAFLVIYENEDAAKVTREFYSRYAINKDALFSLLDAVCVGQKLCRKNDIIFDETITLSDEK